MGYPSALKRNKLLIRATTWVDLKSILLRTKASLKGYILYDFISITLSKGQNGRSGKHGWVAKG